MTVSLSVPTSTRSSSADPLLWQSYRIGNEGARTQLLEAQLGLVHHVARQVARSLAAETDFDELVSAGTIGLIAALEHFDASRGHAFSTFAAPRIRGAILDELRRQDHVPRSVRRKTREIAAGREQLQRDGVPADDAALARQLGIDLPTLWRWQADVEGAHHISLDQPGASADETPATALLFPSDEDGAIDEQLTHEQEVARLKQALVRLKEQERVVLSLYYFEELRISEIATVLELTDSRVSQIRTKALGKLRTQLRPMRAQVA